jgi:hypothetical protein
MSIFALIIQLICGALGGNITGKLFKNIDLGTLGNSLAGILGGGLGGQILSSLGAFGGNAAGGSLDLSTIIGSILSGGVGGGVLMAIIGFVKRLMMRPSH